MLGAGSRGAGHGAAGAGGTAEGCANRQKLASVLGVGAGAGGGKTVKSRNYFLQLSVFIYSLEAAAFIEGRDEVGGSCGSSRSFAVSPKTSARLWSSVFQRRV